MCFYARLRVYRAVANLLHEIAPPKPRFTSQKYHINYLKNGLFLINVYSSFFAGGDNRVDHTFESLHRMRTDSAESN